MIGEMLILNSDDDTTEIAVKSDSLLYELPHDRSAQLMYDHSEFAEALLNNVDERTQERAVK